MDITLEIVKNWWGRLGVPGTELHIGGETKAAYHAARLLTKEPLESGVLYLASDQAAWERLENTGAGLVLTRPPEKESASLFRETAVAWVQGPGGVEPAEVFNRLLGIFDFFNRRELALRRALYADHPLQAMLDMLCEDLGNPAYIVDQSFKVLAMDQDPDLPFYSINWKRIREHGYLPFNVVSSILQNHEWDPIWEAKEPVLVSTKEFSVPFLTQNLWSRGQVRWHLFVCEILRYITPGDMDLIRIYSGYLLECLVSDAQYSSVRGNYHQYFFQKVLTGELTSELSIREQLEPLGWQADGLYCVLEIRSKGGDGYFREAASSQLERLAGGKTLLYENRLLTVFPLAEPEQYQKVADKVRTFLEVTDSFGAMSDLFCGFAQLGIYAKQTQAALCRGGETRLLFYRDCALHHLLSLCQQPGELDAVCHSAVLYLERYDRENHSDHGRTLYEFIRHDRNLVKTAQALHIHRNTLVYRMERIHELLDLPLDDPDLRLRLLLSYEIRRDRAGHTPM
jgi:hypothetical protein